MTRAISCILAVLIATAPLAGCGNKGALVLPDQQPAKKHRSATDPTAAPGQPASPTMQGSGSTDGQH